MALELLFKLLEFALLTLSAHWGIKVSSETLTYVRINGLILLVPVFIAAVFTATGFIPAFLAIFLFFVLRRTSPGLSFVAALFAFMVFFVGAIASTIALGILGTYLHVPGYEIRGTLDELLHRTVMG